MICHKIGVIWNKWNCPLLIPISKNWGEKFSTSVKKNHNMFSRGMNFLIHSNYFDFFLLLQAFSSKYIWHSFLIVDNNCPVLFFSLRPKVRFWTLFVKTLKKNLSCGWCSVSQRRKERTSDLVNESGIMTLLATQCNQ